MNIIHLVSNKVWGGGERYALDICRRLAADGHSVAVITRGREAVDEPFRRAGFEPGHLPFGGIFDFVSPSRLAAVADRMDAPVLIAVHNFKDARLAVNARKLMKQPGKVRIVATRHLVKPGKTDRTSAQLYTALDAIMFDSKAALDAFLSTNPKVDRAKLHVLYPGIEIPEKPATKEASDAVVIGYLGRISPEKGLDTLLAAMPQLAGLPVRLRIAGTGEARYVQQMHERARLLGIADRVEWLGHITDSYGFAAAADIGVVPTLVPECFGLTVVEFMAMGTPVVATAAGGPAEIITPCTDGILVPPGDPDMLAKALRTLAENDKIRTEMGRKARETVERRFAYDTFYTKLSEIYGI